MNRKIYKKMHDLKLDSLVNFLVHSGVGLEDLTTEGGMNILQHHLATIRILMKVEKSVLTDLRGKEALKYSGLAKQLLKRN